MQPDDYAKSLTLASPLRISMKSVNIEQDVKKDDVYTILIGAAMNPVVAIPFNATASQQRFKIVVGLTLLSGMIAVGGIIGYRILKKTE
jgi:hypothetical protein